LKPQAAVLELQRSAGNQAVARAIASRRTLQRMSVVSHANDGSEIVLFTHDEPQPPLGDGYEYELRGANEQGKLYKRRMISHQGMPEERRGPGLLESGKHQNYGTFSGAPAKGGTVRPNPSKYFPQQGQIDANTYSPGLAGGTIVSVEEMFSSGYSGPGRFIDGSDVQSLADQIQRNGEALAQSAGTNISAVFSSMASTVKGVFTGGDGTTIKDEKEVREKLAPVLKSPVVEHYLMTHSRGNLARTGGSIGLSFFTAGISSIVENVGSALGSGGLGAELGKIASDATDAHTNAHSAEERLKLTPDELIGAIGTLALHFGGASVVSGIKAIPTVGTVVGLAQTGMRKFGGSIDDAKRACDIIATHFRNGDLEARKVVNLLGVPHGVVEASGGEEALKGRL
jgi:hypothetical protein